ncbi:MAG: DUF4174 domain-containing protein [Flavobacterium sp.]|nr:DUF4174 domain-containing protein [Pedobacter sp.]
MHSYLTLIIILTSVMDQFTSHRQLLIFAKEQNPKLVTEQINLLNQEAEGVKERDIKIGVVEKASPLYKKYKVDPSQFTVVLVGKDQTEKYRKNTIISAADLFALIDAMPMRKIEMGKKSGLK